MLSFELRTWNAFDCNSIENSEPCSVSGSIANEPEPLFLCLVYVRIVITNLRVCH